jgi:glycosyltransferase involved in cell wall biosynthesis
MNGKTPGEVKVSVIMNCFNSDKYLKQAVESVLCQTYKNFELIFWDNQSTDNSSKIIKSYDENRIKYYYADEFTSLGNARNLAISKATGEWIAFLDADDIWHCNKLYESISELNKFKDKDNVSLIYTTTEMIDSESNVIGKYVRYDSGNIHNSLLKDKNFIVQSSIMVKLATFNEVGGINPSLSFCPDYDMLLKVSKNNCAIGINKVLTYYRVHSESITSTKIYDNTIEVTDFMINYLKENPQNILLNLFVKKNIIYGITALILKLLLKKEIKNILAVFRKYYMYILFSPIVLAEIIINRIKNIKARS